MLYCGMIISNTVNKLTKIWQNSPKRLVTRRGARGRNEYRIWQLRESDLG